MTSHLVFAGQREDVRYALVPAGDQRWLDALASIRHDVYHLPGYAALSARGDGGHAYAFLAHDEHCRLLLPLILRDIPPALWDAGTLRDVTAPYGYPGLICEYPDRDAGASFVARALACLEDALREAGAVSLFSRFHPLLPVEPDWLSPAGDVIPNGHTVAIDLSLDEEQLWKQLRSNHRRDITKAKARGDVVQVEEDWAALAGFVRAYEETMARVGATAYYSFDDAYYAGLREALGGHVHLLTVRRDGSVIAGAILTECGGIVQYHLGGTLNDFLPGNPIKLLFHEASRWFKSRGNRWLHLGGGVGGGDDSLMHFKLGFSPVTFPFRTWRVILDDERYLELLQRTGHDPEAARAGSFFPAYRRPAAAQ